MPSPTEHNFETWTAPGVEAFRFWISFFPTAPLFGVEWRYGDLMGEFGGEPGVKGATAKVAKAPVKPTPSEVAPAKAEPVKRAKAEPAPAKAAPAPAKKTAPKPVPAAKAEKAVVVEIPKAVIPKPDAKPASKPVAKPKAVEAAAKPEATPAPKVATSEPKAAKPEPKKVKPEPKANPDDLKLIKGVGPGLEKQLNGLGIYRFDQIAAMSKADLQSVDDRLTSFKGRCFRDDWVGQAKTLIG